MNEQENGKNTGEVSQELSATTEAQEALSVEERAAARAEQLECLTHQELVKTQLKVLLLHLAARSKSPSAELESLLHEVIDELHEEVRQALEQRAQLRLVVGGAEAPSDL